MSVYIFYNKYIILIFFNVTKYNIAYNESKFFKLKLKAIWNYIDQHLMYCSLHFYNYIIFLLMFSNLF